MALLYGIAHDIDEYHKELAEEYYANLTDDEIIDNPRYLEGRVLDPKLIQAFIASGGTL